MSIIAVLSTVFDAQTSGLEKGIDRASKKAGELNDALSIDDLKGFAAELASFAGVALSLEEGFTRITTAFQTLDDLAKSAQKLGIASDELAGLRHAASLAGVEADALDGSLEKMASTTYAASQGVKKAADSLNALNLNGAELAKLPLEEQFFRITEALAGLDDQTAKLALTQKIFGDTDLIPLLDQGTTSIREQAAEAQKLGIAFNDIELAAIEDANDEFSRMQTAIDGLTQRLAIQLAPVASSVFSDLTALLGEANAGLDIQADALRAQSSGWNSITLAVANLADGCALLFEIFRAINIAITEISVGGGKGLRELVRVTGQALKDASGGNLGWDPQANSKTLDDANAWLEANKKAAGEFWGGKHGTTHFERATEELKKRADKLDELHKKLSMPHELRIPKIKIPDLDLQSKLDDAADVKGGGEFQRTLPGAFEMGSKEAFDVIANNSGEQGTMVEQQRELIEGQKVMSELLKEQVSGTEALIRHFKDAGVKFIIG